MTTTRAVILAAGRGSRLGRLTDDHPKAMTLLGGRPLIQWQLAALRGAGIAEIAVVDGYARERLTAPGAYRFHNPRWAESNMVVSLLVADAWLSRAPCLVAYADLIYGAGVVAKLAGSAADIGISFDTDWLTLWSRRFADPLSDAESFRCDAVDGRLLEIGARAGSVTDIAGQYMGLLRFTPAGWAVVRGYLDTLPPERVDRLDMTALLAALLAVGVRVDTVPVAGGWAEVDTPTDLALYEAMLAEGSLVLDVGAADAAG